MSDAVDEVNAINHWKAGSIVCPLAFGPVGKYAELENREESGSQTQCSKLKMQFSVLNPILEGTALEVNKQFSQ